jgi:Putative transposase
MTLVVDEFMRRFLQHTIPDGFHRIRHIGFLANGHRTDKLALCRALLAARSPEPPPSKTYRERTRRLTGTSLELGPDCGGAMQERGPLPWLPTGTRAILVRPLMTSDGLPRQNQIGRDLDGGIETAELGPTTNRSPSMPMSVAPSALSAQHRHRLSRASYVWHDAKRRSQSPCACRRR